MASKTVNRPTDVKFKEQDVNNKLQLYGIYSAFAQGKVPSNQQIDVALNSAIASKVFNSKSDKLSGEGQRLVDDLKNVIEQAKLLLLSKNEGNLLQEFIWETQHISGADASLPNAPVDKDTAKQHGNEALEGLRTLGALAISNGQFRKLLSDAAILLRSMAGDAASKTAGKVQPSESDLNQIDRPAEDNVWHENPELSKDKLKSKLPFGKKELQDAANAGVSTAHPDGSTDPREAAELAARDQQQGTSSGVDARAGASAAVNILKEKADTGDAGQKAKDKKREYNERTQNYLKGKMPKERREQTIWRLKKMIVEVQGHSDYQQAIETLLRLAEEYTGHTKSIAAQSQGTVKDAHGDNSLKTAETNFKTLLERFANGTSLDDFFEALNQIYKDADQDPELKKWFTDINAFIRRCLREQGYILQPDSTDAYNKLYDHGNYLLRNKYKTHTDRILDEIKFFGNQFDEDTQNRQFGDAVQKLFLDLGNDENGKTTFKPHLLKDVTEVILPRALETIHYIPIPRLEYSDPMVDFIIENLIVESDNLAPNVLEFSSDNYWKWGRKTIKNKNKNKVMLAVSGIQMDLRDVSFYIKKKSGFPSLTDQGLCDIFMGGDGFSFKLAMQTADKTSKTNFFEVTDVKVQVKHLNIKLKQSKHKLLFAIGKPLILKAIRPALQKVLEAMIKQKAHELDGIIYQINKEAQQAKNDALNNPDPENIKNIYQHYWQSANNQWMKAKQKKEKAEEKLADKKFNMAMTQHDSIFPNVKLPSGISTKATEYKELSKKGDKWESPVFGIGSARGSTNIPAAPKISRKSNVSKVGSVLGNNSSNTGSSGYTNGSSYVPGSTQGQYNNSQGQFNSNPQGQFNSNPNQGYGTATQFVNNAAPQGYSNGQAPLQSKPLGQEPLGQTLGQAPQQPFRGTFDPSNA